MPAAVPGALPARFRWPIGGTCSRTCARWLNAGWPAFMAVCAACRRFRAEPRHGALRPIRAVGPKPLRRRTAVPGAMSCMRRFGGVSRRARRCSRSVGHGGSPAVPCAATPTHSSFLSGGILAPYREHLEARLAEGNENAAALWREFKDRGFAGSAKQVRRWLNQWRTTLAKFTPHKWRPRHTETTSAPAAGPFPALISPRQLAWRLVSAAEPNLDYTAVGAA